MAIDVQGLLANAYQLDQAGHDRAAAVAALKAALKDEDTAEALRGEFTRLGAVVRARESGCHDSRVMYDLLMAAFGVSPGDSAASVQGQTALIYDIVGKALT